MTKKEKKQIMELIDTIQSAMCTLQAIIEKDEEKNRLSFAIPNLKAGQ